MSSPVGVHEAEIELGFAVSLVGGLAVPTPLPARNPAARLIE